MPEKRTQYYDAYGVRRTLITDDDRPHQFIVQTEQVLDEILAGVQRDRELMAANDNKSPIRHVGRFPVHIFERMVREGWGPDDEARWMNSAEAAEFRIWRGRLGRDR